MPPRIAILLRKLTSRHNWRGFIGLLKSCANPTAIIGRYYFGVGSYPVYAWLRTPIGQVALEMYSREDLITLHEVFFREDYGITGRCAKRLRVAVDFGANIGITTAYFLTRNREVRVYSYEPVPNNVDRARKNLATFVDRVELNDYAVGTEQGMTSFGIEASGRYGGIGVPHSEQIQVPCHRGDAELERILQEHHGIDVLKVDVEGMETPLLRSIDEKRLGAIGNIFAECGCGELLLPGFDCSQNLSITSFHRKP
jgi:FkbM family methyltransferase